MKTLFKSVCKILSKSIRRSQSNLRQSNWSSSNTNIAVPIQRRNREPDYLKNCELAGKLDLTSLQNLDSSNLGVLLYSAYRANNFEVARKVFQAIRIPRGVDFSQYISLLGKYGGTSSSIDSELSSIWSKIVNSRCDGDAKLVTCLLKAISSKSQQKKVICQIIANTARETYDCGVLASFLKICITNNDKALAETVWEWGEIIRSKEFGSLFYFSTLFQYHDLVGASISEYEAIWNQITECGMNDNPKLVNFMCSALEIDPSKQKQFISMVISNPPKPDFHCGLLSTFLKYCCESNDKKLAGNVWEWGKSIRGREVGSRHYFSTSFQYHTLFGASVSELKTIWNQMAEFHMHEKKELVISMCVALEIDPIEQKHFISMIVSNAPKEPFSCREFGVFLKHCCETNDEELGMKVWEWGKSIREREFGSFFYFSNIFQYYTLFGATVSELKTIWKQITECGLNEKVDLVNQMCVALAVDPSEQKLFISMIISNPPNSSFNCRHLGVFLKHCCETNDKELGIKVWEWGKSIRDREFGSLFYFSNCFQYYTLFDASEIELKTIWNQITECGLNEKADLVTSMCLALAFDPSEQKQFISMIVSNPPISSFKCRDLGVFLLPCSMQKDLPLAQLVWSWGYCIREREKGSWDLHQITIQYLGICSKSGDLDLVESVWKKAEQVDVTYLKKVKNAYLTAVASHGDTERAIKCVDMVGADSLNCHTVTILLKSISDSGDYKGSLELLRHFQRENASAVSIIPYNSVIDGLCRLGDFGAAFSLLEEAKSNNHEPSAATWTSILCGCRKHQNLPLALVAFEELKRMETNESRLTKAYHMMADIYKACGDELKEKEIHQERLDRGLRMSRREVKLDLDGSLKLSFFSNQIPSNLGTEESEKIDRQLREWIPVIESRNISVEPILARNGEMIALAYAVAVLNMKEVVLRKDFGISVESHEISRVLSGILEIIIRHKDNAGNKDLTREHIMREGKCSCRVIY